MIYIYPVYIFAVPIIPEFLYDIQHPNAPLTKELPSYSSSILNKTGSDTGK